MTQLYWIEDETNRYCGEAVVFESGLAVLHFHDKLYNGTDGRGSVSIFEDLERLEGFLDALNTDDAPVGILKRRYTLGDAFEEAINNTPGMED